MNLSELFLNRFLYKTPLQNLETKDAVYDASNVIPVAVPPLSAGGAAQDINTNNVFINGAQLEPGTFPVTVLDVSNWGWGQTCVFSSPSNVQVNWGLGTFTSASGESYSISAGNTGTMAAKTYIYLDLNVSITAYQITTTPADAVGIGKVLIAVAKNSTAPDNATYNLSEATQIVGDNILANSIDASKITAGTITVLGNVTSGSFALGTDAWHVDSSGNMWWQAYSTYALALAGQAPVISSNGTMNYLRIANSANIASFGLDIQLTHASNTASAVQIVQSGAGFGMNQTISGSSKGIYIANSGSGNSIVLSHSGAANTIDITDSGDGNSINITKSNDGAAINIINGADKSIVIAHNNNDIAVDITHVGTTFNPVISLVKNATGDVGAVQLLQNTAANSANYIAGLEINLSNAGAGLEYAFDFEGAEKGVTAAGNSGFVSNSTGTFTAVGYVRVRVGGSTYYMPYGTIA